MGDTVSVRGSAPIQQDQVLSVDERWERQSQCAVLHLSSKITYFLLAMGEIELVRGSEAIQHDPVQAVSG